MVLYWQAKVSVAAVGRVGSCPQCVSSHAWLLSDVHARLCDTLAGDGVAKTGLAERRAARGHPQQVAGIRWERCAPSGETRLRGRVPWCPWCVTLRHVVVRVS